MSAVVNAPGYSSEEMPIAFHKDYEEMLRAIRQEAKAGDVVLFSPASASFDRFPNFMKRGEYFKDLVRALQ